MSTKQTNGAATAKPANVISIAENTVLLSLDFSSFGNSRTVDSRSVIDSAETDPRLVKVQKVLFESAEFAAIKTADGHIKRFIESRSLPGIFKTGTFLVPIPLVQGIETHLHELRKWRDGLVDAFVAVLPSLIELSKKRLGPLFNATDYPSPEGMKASFGFRWSYLSLQTPKSLQGVSAELFQKEQEKMQGLWKEAHGELTNLLRGQMLDLVAKMNSALAPGQEGKKKAFKGASITKIAEFLEIFDARNVTNDEQLKALVKQARDLINGVDAKTINDNDRVKTKLSAAFGNMEATLAGMVTDAPSRKITTANDDV